VLKQPGSADGAVHAGTDHQDSGTVTCHNAPANNRRGDTAGPVLIGDCYDPGDNADAGRTEAHLGGCRCPSHSDLRSPAKSKSAG
jgi:hypothetical protein